MGKEETARGPGDCNTGVSIVSTTPSSPLPCAPADLCRLPTFCCMLSSPYAKSKVNFLPPSSGSLGLVMTTVRRSSMATMFFEPSVVSRELIGRHRTATCCASRWVRRRSLRHERTEGKKRASSSYFTYTCPVPSPTFTFSAMASRSCRPLHVHRTRALSPRACIRLWARETLASQIKKIRERVADQRPFAHPIFERGRPTRLPSSGGGS